MLRLGLLLTGLCLPGWVMAACTGTDVRATLSAQQTAEIAAAVEAEPYARGNFWRAERGGRVITLLGTVHLDDPRLDPIADAFVDDIGRAERLFLEMTAVEQARLETRLSNDPAMILLPQGSLIEYLPEATWTRLKAAAEARGLPGVMAARMQPWYLSLVLALPPCALAAGAPEGLDKRLEDLAERAGVPTAPLEPYDTLFRLFAQEPLERQLEFLGASIMDDATAENMLATTLNLYFEQAHAELWHLSRIAARAQIDIAPDRLDALFVELEEALLIERNRAWIDVLEAAPETRLVAAFGAAHLFGPEGVLRLLEEAGYTLTRIAP